MTQEQDGAAASAETPEQTEQPTLQLVKLSEFRAVAYEAPLADTNSIYCTSLAGFYAKAAKAASEEGRERDARVYRLLADTAHMHFKPEDRAEPYGPLFVIDGRRSIIPDDLHGEQSAAFAALAPDVKNAGLRALLADIAWLNDRSLAGMAQLAIGSFCDAVQQVKDGNATLYFDDETASSHNAADMLRRACQIANATGWKDPEASALKALISSIRQTASDEEEAGGYLTFGELDADYGIGDLAVIAAQAEALAGKDDIDPETARHLWELAARAHRQAGQDDESNRCLIQAAECYVAMASAADFKGMAAASWLMDAIKALRRLPGTKERRTALEEKLRAAQASISDEMGVVSTEIDLSQIVDHARKTVKGLTLVQALAEFARLDASPAPDELRKQAKEQAEKNPLSSIVPMAIHDDEGKLVAKSPGLLDSEDSEDTALRHLIVHHESYRRHVTSTGAIDPARRLIQAEHPLHSRHFLPLAEMSPFVPAGHEDLFALGFARFFGGDFISALHILVPQLENSLRYVLKQAAIDPSAIQNDMTQENRTISVMLDKDRVALEKIFGEAIIFEIENLFDFRGGPSLRHELAHGMVTAGACYSSDALYACWFIFRLCLLPLFAHWEHVTQVYEAL